MRALVTGGTGFVGFHVARSLVERGHAVRVLARDPAKAERLFAGSGVEIAAGDMTDAGAVQRALTGCEALVHAAAAVSLDPREAARTLRDNVGGAEVTLASAAAAGIARILYVSSLTTIWELPGPDPSAASPLREGTAGYARAKVEAERVVRGAQNRGAPIAIVHPCGVIGPDDPGLSEAVRALRGFARATLATSGGLSSVDARDLALFCVRLLEEKRVGRFVVGGQFQRWDEVARELAAITGARPARVRAPGALLRLAGSAFDALRRVRPIASPISREAMEYATRMRTLPNDAALAELGVALRPLAETYRDTVRSLEARGRMHRAASPIPR